jgi:hypothetical protein
MPMRHGPPQLGRRTRCTSVSRRRSAGGRRGR